MTTIQQPALLATQPLYLDRPTWRILLRQCGPSLGLWRAAEVAALRQQSFVPPILDLGCGDALVASLVLSQVDIGLDPSQQALAQAQRSTVYRRLVPATIEQAPLPPGSLATIFSNSVLEHIESIDRALHMIGALLRPGGRLIFTVPSEAFSGWLALPLTRYAAWRNRRLSHLNLWSPECWAEHLQRAGLELEYQGQHLRRGLVWLWDVLELLQQIRAAGRPLAGRLWRRLPAGALDRLATHAARIDLSAPPPGGGRLLVARKPNSMAEALSM